MRWGIAHLLVGHWLETSAVGSARAAVVGYAALGGAARACEHGHASMRSYKVCQLVEVCVGGGWGGWGHGGGWGVGGWLDELCWQQGAITSDSVLYEWSIAAASCCHMCQPAARCHRKHLTRQRCIVAVLYISMSCNNCSVLDQRIHMCTSPKHCGVWHTPDWAHRHTGLQAHRRPWPAPQVPWRATPTPPCPAPPARAAPGTASTAPCCAHMF